MEFYLGLMRREVCMNIDDNEPILENDTNYDHYCYPLCEKKFKNGDIMRHISPCGHIFHEKCIKTFESFNGEKLVNTCPVCRSAYTRVDFEN